MVELLGDEDQIEEVDGTIAVGVRCGLAEAISDLHQIQDPTLLRPLVAGVGQNFPNPF